MMLEATWNWAADPIVRALGEAWYWLAEISFGSIFVRLFLAFICAGVIGIERATKRHAAGLRTYILVSVGACIAMFTNQFIYSFVESGDVSRLASGVVGGLGFLGAGGILLTNRQKIRGLTTASGLWASGCIGLAIGIGFYTLALVGTFLVFFSLVMLPRFERLFINRAKFFDLHIEITNKEKLKDLTDLIRSRNVRICNITANPSYSGTGIAAYVFTLEGFKEKGKRFRGHDMIIKEIQALDYVNYVEQDD